MKVLFLVSLLGLLLYVVTLPACQYRALQQATRAAVQEDFATAWMYELPLLQEKPAFFSGRAKALCGQISIQQARALATKPEPDFGEAAQVLLGQEKRCQGYEHRETRPLLEKIATLHLTHGVARCRQKDYVGALGTFQTISTLAYPERFLGEATSEAAWCRLTWAQELAEDEWFEEAAEQLVRAMSSGDSTVRTAALRQVPSVVEKEMLFWLQHMQVIRAFNVLDQRKRDFGAEPEVRVFFLRLESQIEIQVFGRVLAQPCMGKLETHREKTAVPIAAESAQPSGLTKTNLTVQNNTGDDLQILLRGSTPNALRLRPREQKSLWLEPGEYVVGMFAPGKCTVQPRLTAWTVEPFMHRTIEIVMQNF